MRFTRQMACSSVWSRIGLSRYIACRIGASKPVSSLEVTMTDLQRVGRVAEAVEQLLLGVPVAPVGRVLGGSPLFTVMTMSLASGGR